MRKAGEKYFVTGGTGFIGGRLIEYLLKKGFQVNALVRPQSIDKLTIDNPNLELIKGDLFDNHALIQGMEGCDGVFHLAAIAKPWAKDESEFYEVNVDGTRQVMEAANNTGIKKVSFTSTAGIMAPSKDLPVTENTPRYLPYFTPYERTKSEAEKLVREYGERTAMETVIVNPPRVFGPGKMSKSNAVTEIMNRYVNGHWRLTLGDGKSIGNYAYIEDVVKGHYLAMKNGKNGERYILGGHNLSFNEFFHELRNVSGVSRKLIHVPLWLALAFARFEKWKANTFGRPPLITPDWVNKYHHHWALSSEKAKRELGHEITPLETGLQKTIDWLQVAG